MMVKKFSNLEVRFTTFRPTLTVCHPCGLHNTVNVIEGGSAEWAFLQTYEEVDAGGNAQGLMLDNDGSNGQKVPFYSASHLSPWCGKYSDEPCDNIPVGGSLFMYTSLCEVDFNGKPDDTPRWNYKMLLNVKWGFTKRNTGSVCLELQEFTNCEMKSKLRPIDDAFPGISVT